MAPSAPTSYSSTDGEVRFQLPAGTQSGQPAGITGTRLVSGPGAGIDLIELCSGPLKVWIVPTRGMGIWRAELNGIPVEWKSPVRQLVHPKLVNLQARNGLGWLDGFSELVCRCGLAFNGPPETDSGAKSPIESEVTLHGRIANIPAHSVEARIEGDLLVCEGRVAESTLFGPQLELKTRVELPLGGTAFEVIDEVTNLGSGATELELLYHINVGRPFLDEGAKVAIPHRQVVPRDPRAAEGIDSYPTYLGPTAGYAEQAYFYEPIADAGGRTIALLRNAAGDRGFSVEFSPAELPRFVTWKCTHPEADGYVTGLEPATNLPNPKSFERQQGRVISLPSGQTYRSSFRIRIDDTTSGVREVESRIAAIQGSTAPTIHRTPQKGWSPSGG